MERRFGLGLSRILALVAVVAVLALSYARGLTTYLSQQHDIQVTQAANDARRADISRLENEAARWSDPGYIRAQARARLGWVLPGEIGYRVMTADGTLLGAETPPSTPPTETVEEVWYAQLWASLKAADRPFVFQLEEAPSVAEAPGLVTPGDVETPD